MVITLWGEKGWHSSLTAPADTNFSYATAYTPSPPGTNIILNLKNLSNPISNAKTKLMLWASILRSNNCSGGQEWGKYPRGKRPEKDERRGEWPSPYNTYLVIFMLHTRERKLVYCLLIFTHKSKIHVSLQMSHDGTTSKCMAPPS